MEIENVRVILRIKPISSEEWMEDHEDILNVDGNIITVNPPNEVNENTSLISQDFLKTPVSNKTGPPLTPKTPKYKNDLIQRELFSPDSSGFQTPVKNNPLNPTNTNLKTKLEKKKFAFDRILGPDASQEAIYSSVDPYIQSVLEGYNSTIFVYGQTGSGKTYTMSGDSSNPGIIPRSIERIFELMKNRSQAIFSVQLTYVELYLDKFIDLLDQNNSNRSKKKRLPSFKPPKIEIHEDSNGLVYLTGSDTLRVPVISAEQALELIFQASKNRTVAATQMNATSSRSHSILTLHIECRENLDYHSPVLIGKLNLVDLAGSERLTKSGAEGINKKETQNINSSLSALGDVLSALSSKSYNGPIPYRNSKLTRLLQDSLGGNSKTLFIINVQASSPNYSETLMSLMYGQRAKKIKNLTSQNKDVTNEEDLEKMYLELSQVREKLVERTREFQILKSREMHITEENNLLKQKMDVLSKINQMEIEKMENQLNDIILSQQGHLTETKLAYFQLQTEIDSYRMETNRLKIQLLSSEDEKESLSQSIQKMENEIFELQEEIVTHKEEIETLKKGREVLLKKLEETNVQTETQLKEMKNIDSKAIEYQKLKKNLNVIEYQLQLKEEELQQCKKQVEKKNKELSQMINEHDQLKHENSQLKKLKLDTHQERDDLQTKFQTEYKQLDNQYQQVLQENKKLQKQLQDLQSRLGLEENARKELQELVTKSVSTAPPSFLPSPSSPEEDLKTVQGKSSKKTKRSQKPELERDEEEEKLESKRRKKSTDPTTQESKPEFLKKNQSNATEELPQKTTKSNKRKTPLKAEKEEESKQPSPVKKQKKVDSPVQVSMDLVTEEEDPEIEIRTFNTQTISKKKSTQTKKAAQSSSKKVSTSQKKTKVPSPTLSPIKTNDTVFDQMLGNFDNAKLLETFGKSKISKKFVGDENVDSNTQEIVHPLSPQESALNVLLPDKAKKSSTTTNALKAIFSRTGFSIPKLKTNQT